MGEREEKFDWGTTGIFSYIRAFFSLLSCVESTYHYLTYKHI